MSGLFHVGHVAQLNEIQNARLKRNQPGIGEEVQELIRRLTSGGIAGKSDDIREAQAKRFWDLGVGRELGFKSFEAYLETIPQLLPELLKDDAAFPLVMLVETRIGLRRLCELGGIDFEGSDETFIAYDVTCAEFVLPTWIRIQDGRKNQNRSIRDCRKTFCAHELGLTALQGVCAFIHDPTVVSETTQEGAHVMDLSGSVLRGDRVSAAFLKLWRGRPLLGWSWDDSASPGFGSASRREC